jgi:hypothetical protein
MRALVVIVVQPVMQITLTMPEFENLVLLKPNYFFRIQSPAFCKSCPIPEIIPPTVPQLLNTAQTKKTSNNLMLTPC